MTLGPCTLQIGDPDGAPGSWFQPRKVLISQSIFHVNLLESIRISKFCISQTQISSWSTLTFPLHTGHSRGSAVISSIYLGECLSPCYPTMTQEAARRTWRPQHQHLLVQMHLPVTWTHRCKLDLLDSALLTSSLTG